MLRRVGFWLSLLASLPALANLDGANWTFHFNNQNYSFPRAGSIRGTPYVCLEEFIRQFSLQVLYVPSAFEMTLKDPKSGRFVRFKSWSRAVELYLNPKQRVMVELSRAPEFIGPKLCVPIDFGDRSLRPMLTGIAPDNLATSSNDLVSQKKLQALVVIDPGHGGNDLGSQSDAQLEKILALQFAVKLQESLSKQGISAVLTRSSDTFVTLPERSRFANQVKGAKLFISLHLNADPNFKARGFEVYVLSLTKDDENGRAAVAREQQNIPQDLPEGIEKTLADLKSQANFEASLKWAKTFRSSLQEFLPPSSTKNVRTGPFYVLYASQMPSVLLELGYMTDLEDRTFWSDEAKQFLVAEKLAADLKKVLLPTR